MTFYVIRKGRGGGLRGFVAAKAVLLRVYWIESDTLLHMPRTQLFQGFEKIVGK